MDYSKTKLSKYKTEADVLAAKEAAKPAAKVKAKDPTITQEKVDSLWPYLPWFGKSSYPTDKEEFTKFTNAADASGLTVDQVKQLWEEFKTVAPNEEE
jgi:hypothetical protein|tara:strand:+ start:2396 stop:2689 length:294 start_codon:yes stop_codon:yes gene_type:complete